MEFQKEMVQEKGEEQIKKETPLVAKIKIK